MSARGLCPYDIFKSAIPEGWITDSGMKYVMVAFVKVKCYYNIWEKILLTECKWFFYALCVLFKI